MVTGSEEGAALGSQSAVVHGLRSIMIAPLQLEGRLLGVVYLDSRVAKGIFTEDDVDILAAITNHVAVSLETARAAQLEVAVQAARQQRDMAETLRAAMTGSPPRSTRNRCCTCCATSWPTRCPPTGSSCCTATDRPSPPPARSTVACGRSDRHRRTAGARTGDTAPSSVRARGRRRPAAGWWRR